MEHLFVINDRKRYNLILMMTLILIVIVFLFVAYSVL